MTGTYARRREPSYGGNLASASVGGRTYDLTAGREVIGMCRRARGYSRSGYDVEWTITPADGMTYHLARDVHAGSAPLEMLLDALGAGDV